MLSQLTVHQDEVCLFCKGGTVAGVLQAKGGSYTLDSHNIPFLSTFLEGFTGGNMFMAELWFVLTREVVGQKFGARSVSSRIRPSRWWRSRRWCMASSR